MEYITEEKEGTWSLIEVNEEGKKTVVAVFFVDTHARIVCRLMNEYVNKMSFGGQ